MPRPRSSRPSYCHDRTRGRAYVTIDGRKLDLGPHGSPESHDKYELLVSEWIAQGRPRGLPTGGPPAVLRVKQVIAGFWAWAETAYPSPAVPDGQRPKGELGNYWDALKPLRRLYGDAPAVEFGPKSLKALREAMIQPRTETDPATGEVRTYPGWCRKLANRQVGRIRAVFRWAVENELLPGEVIHRLDAVKGLRQGRSAARESDPVKPVPQPHVDAVLPLLAPHLRAMVELQLLTGMRPGEICAMRTRDIDSTGQVKAYRPEHHKTAHHGKAREILIGPRAWEVLRPHLKPDLLAPVFSPAAAKKGRRRSSTLAYSVASYRRAIRRACIRADRAAHTADPSIPADIITVPIWSPNQLRHSAGTRVRKQHGAEVARVFLGHSKLSTTEIYAEQDRQKVAEIVAGSG